MTSRNFLTIDDFDTDGKTILVRVDLNSPGWTHKATF